MKLTEQEIDNAIRNAINEYGNDWDYPMGSDDSSAPWNQVDTPTEEKEFSYAIPAAPLLIYAAKEFAGVEDEAKLAAIKSIAEKLPSEVYIYASYEIPLEDDWDEEGHTLSPNYDEAEETDFATCVGQGEDYHSYVYLPKWVEQHHLTDDPEILEIIKKSIDEFDESVKEDCGIEDFMGNSKYGYNTLDDTKKDLEAYDISNIGGAAAAPTQEPEPDQNVMNESAMRHLIYEKVLKALDECC